ncbi:MAG: FAD-dependent oxidoreductase [Asgard group archaeon]|nr:FAD-dependent oxidoreductase [Asgard group archaeon]
MENNNCDLAIIGSGLTGLSAAIAAYSRNPDLKIKLFGIPFDSNTAKKGEIENIPGINKIVGVDFIQQLVQQVESFNLEFAQDKLGEERAEETSDTQVPEEMKQDFPKIIVTNEMISSVSKSESGFEIKTEQETIKSNAIIISTGVPELKQTIKGEDEFEHKGVSYCAVCDGALYRGKKVAIIGKGNFVARGTLFLRKYCRKITLLCPTDELKCDKRFLKKLQLAQNIVIKTGIDLSTIEISGTQMVQGLRYREDDEVKDISVNGVFIELKDKPDFSIFANLNLEKTSEGFIKTNENGSTNVEGVFAAGTVKGELDYAPILMGDGYKTGYHATNSLKKKD